MMKWCSLMSIGCFKNLNIISLFCLLNQLVTKSSFFVFFKEFVSDFWKSKTLSTLRFHFFNKKIHFNDILLKISCTFITRKSSVSYILWSIFWFNHFNHSEREIALVVPQNSRETNGNHGTENLIALVVPQNSREITAPERSTGNHLHVVSK